MQSFHADVKEGWFLFRGEWLTLKCFMGGWCRFPRGRHSPNSRTAYKYHYVFTLLPIVIWLLPISRFLRVRMGNTASNFEET